MQRLLVVALAFYPGCGGAEPRPAADTRAERGEPTTAEAPAPEPLVVEGGPLTITIHRSRERTGSVNSYLLSGESEALLVDAQLVSSEARRLAALVRDSGKRLTTIYVTHGHPDHFVGLTVLREAFPEARIVARPRVAEAMPRLFERYREPLVRFFPGDIPESVVTPETLESDTLEVEGTTIRILEFEGGESEYTTALHIPSMQALFCADMVYHHVHPWLNELRIEGVLAHVEQVRAMEGVTRIYPGHGDPIGPEYLDTYVGYVNAFVEELRSAPSADALVATMLARFPDWKTQAGLRFSAQAHIEARDREAR